VSTEHRWGKSPNHFFNKIFHTIKQVVIASNELMQTIATSLYERNSHIFHKCEFLPHKEKRKQADILTPEAESVKTKK
jgi:hypothetical protein